MYTLLLSQRAGVAVTEEGRPASPVVLCGNSPHVSDLYQGD